MTDIYLDIDHPPCPHCGLIRCRCVVDGRTVFRAAVAMQRLGLPFASGAKKRRKLEREFSTGRIKSDYYEPARRKYDRKYEKKRRKDGHQQVE